MWQYLVVVGAKPFPANQNVKYECFHWASKYSILLAGSVYSPWNSSCMYLIVSQIDKWAYTFLQILWQVTDKWPFCDKLNNTIVYSTALHKQCGPLLYWPVPWRDSIVFTSRAYLLNSSKLQSIKHEIRNQSWYPVTYVCMFMKYIFRTLIHCSFIKTWFNASNVRPVYTWDPNSVISQHCVSIQMTQNHHQARCSLQSYIFFYEISLVRYHHSNWRTRSREISR